MAHSPRPSDGEIGLSADVGNVRNLERSRLRAGASAFRHEVKARNRPTWVIPNFRLVDRGRPLLGSSLPLPVAASAPPDLALTRPNA